MRTPSRPIVALVVTLALAAAAIATASNARSGLPQGREPFELDPADFSTTIDNPYYPLRPGDRRVYRKRSPGEPKTRVVEEVTDDTRMIANGIEARVVHVRDLQHGELIEETFDWYAQDRAGNVWYLGEDTQYFENGVPVPRKDSWEAGVDGAQAGVLMPARPRIGLEYRQEDYKDVAQDRSEVLALDVDAEIPRRHFAHALMIGEGSALEPKALDLLFYVRGVGEVLAVEVSGGNEREDLIRFKRG